MSKPGTQSATHDVTYFNVISDIRQKYKSGKRRK